MTRSILRYRSHHRWRNTNVLGVECCKNVAVFFLFLGSVVEAFCIIRSILFFSTRQYSFSSLIILIRSALAVLWIEKTLTPSSAFYVLPFKSIQPEYSSSHSAVSKSILRAYPWSSKSDVASGSGWGEELVSGILPKGEVMGVLCPSPSSTHIFLLQECI